MKRLPIYFIAHWWKLLGIRTFLVCRLLLVIQTRQIVALSEFSPMSKKW